MIVVSSRQITATASFISSMSSRTNFLERYYIRINALTQWLYPHISDVLFYLKNTKESTENKQL